MSQLTQLNRPYGLTHQDNIVRDITDLYNRTNTRLVIEMGPINLDTVAGFNMEIFHTMSATEWKTARLINITFRSDNDDWYVQNSEYSAFFINETSVNFTPTTAGLLDDAEFNNTAGSYNRGWITLEYTPD